MVQVTEMIGDCYLPEGFRREIATRLAQDMREIMNADREEVLIAASVRLYESQCDSNEKLAAWGYLSASERRAWKGFLGYEKFVSSKKLKNVDQ
jgi:hypothetical protein